MTREEFSTLVKGMKAVYSDPTFIPDKDAFEVWYSLLSDLEYKPMQIAIQKYMLTCKKPPTIADIREQNAKPMLKDELTDSEAWNMVYKALCNSNYRAEEEFNKLPEIVQRSVGSPGQLRAWAQDSDFNEGVISSNFKKTFRAMQVRAKEEYQMPQAIKDLIEAKGGNLIESSN